ncbi:acyl-CoA thioester hydrolase/BAAT C-terminal domain-containing protein [Henriciella aquimarina]|uniref:acyl-CoA thioester hydrolase/BAAT C-terminal domain-containing protein n=1 Tax=Henriciella aquimarina TaxID=545261 RepID=UPI000A075155|nr:acyl-CoA thioester hydrolase/BAAT C-terminal domain-containing protein [Henriciella aquimarina]
MNPFSRSAAIMACLSALVILPACQSTPGTLAGESQSAIAATPDEIIELREPDLIADYYPAATAAAPGPAILMVGGSEGGLSDGVARDAEALRQEGFSVLQISFYRFEGQEQNLEMVPLERFDRALDWLLARGEVDADRVGIFGTSKGAEAALITATRRPEIDAVVAIVPSSVSWTGINWDFDGRVPEASWSLRGKPYPALPYGAFAPRTGLYSLYANGLEAVGDHEAAVIAIEKTDAPVLLICGGADGLWPSCPMADAIEARAEAEGGPEVTVLTYPEAGHGAGGVPSGTLDPETAEDPLDWGGTRAANRAAQQDNWPKTVAFLKTTL